MFDMDEIKRQLDNDELDTGTHYSFPERYIHSLMESHIVDINEFGDVDRINYIPNIKLATFIDPIIEATVFGSENIALCEDKEYNSFIMYYEENNASIVCYNESLNCYSLLPVVRNDSTSNENFEFIMGEKCDVELVNIFPSFNTSCDDIVTESLDVDRNGNVHISFDERSYMSQYSEINDSISNNIDNRNLSGLKYDICYLYALISILDEKYHNQKPEYDMEDITKARMFAKGTFKPTLKVIQNMDKDFNFLEFYNSSNITIDGVKITTDNIIGMKKLFATLISGI